MNIHELDAALKKFKVVDLSHTLETGMPRWPTHPAVIVHPTITHEHDNYYCQTLIMGEHSGTHVDAPAHAGRELSTIETYPVDALFGQAVLYDLTVFNPQPGDRITAQQILELESGMNDRAGEGEIVLLKFGWEKYWRSDIGWSWYAQNEPGLDEDAVKLFADRKVKAVGSDNIACDTPVKDGHEFHSYGHKQYWLFQGIFIIEMLKNLDLLPVRSYFITMPLKIKSGSGSPIRPVCLVEV